jgi:putative FmdB family regulatory protein
MPNYSYRCEQCYKDFELFFYIKDYIAQPKCIECQSQKTVRNYVADVITQVSTIKKSNSELKTIGDLALRNSEKMSDDQKHHLYLKHNSYKEQKDLKPLPQGMSRVKKQPKIKWPGTPGIKKKRDIKK